MTTITTVRSNGLLYDSARDENGREIGMAIFSPDRKHRYYLARFLGGLEKSGGPIVCFGMQNPSKAGAEESDPTIDRCTAFAKRLGGRLMCAVNMGAGVATDPKEFLKLSDPIGPLNLIQIEEAVAMADIVIAAWGALGGRNAKRRKLFGPSIEAFRGVGKPLQCLGKTKESGDPRHPLYLRSDTPLEVWP